jgi:hypothetical protein
MKTSINSARARALKNWLQSLRYAFNSLSGGIDVVYTWVDGSDPAFINELNQYRAEEHAIRDPSAAAPSRFRNSDELRYSMRSLEKYATWTNKIFLLTNGQVPDWLNLDHPRLRLCSHAEIFPDLRDLPNFNSLAIEAHIHRIPGLSRHFLYLNDDMFFGRPTVRSDFLSSSGIEKMRVEWWTLPDLLQPGDLTTRWLAYNHELLKNKFDNREFYEIAHVPCIYDRMSVREVEQYWQQEFEAGSARRFRDESAPALHVLYP